MKPEAHCTPIRWRDIETRQLECSATPVFDSCGGSCVSTIDHTRRNHAAVQLPAQSGYFESIKMVELQKSDCSDSIGHGLKLTENWRVKMTREYPDPRIPYAAKCLARLSTEIASLSDADYLRLKPYFEADGPSWRAAISATARAVGFRHRIRDLPSFIDYLVEVLNEPVNA